MKENKRKYVWVINGPIKLISEHNKSIHNSDIGWISSLIPVFHHDERLELVLVFPQNYLAETIYGEIDNIRYFGVFQNNKKSWKINPDFEEQIYKLLFREKPDIIEVWGTEYAHSLDTFNAVKRLNLDNRFLVHIQGLTSVYARHFFAGLSNKMIHSYTIRDFIRHSNIWQEKRKFERRGFREVALLKKANNILGRTDWDRFHVMNINPGATYYKCNESMRSAFFSCEWNYDLCEKNTICVTQGYYPIKGFHILVEAIALIKKFIPDIKVYVAGEKIIYKGKSRLRESSYGKYVRRLMKKHDITSCFEFLGYQDEKGIAKLYQRCNAFVLPSVMENSPNSLAEALIVGIPCISSFVGGVSSMVEHNKDCVLYQHNDPVMLAMYIKKILCHEDYAKELSSNAKKTARINYSAQLNAETLLSIYDQVLKNM